MRIIIINGSPRNNGATAQILKIMQNYLLFRYEANVKYYNVSELNFNYCTGCCYCFRHGKCYMNDDAEQLSNEIASADGIIIGSPTYASNITGQLKAFLDRGHFVIEQLLHNKYAVGIITGENYGSSSAASILKKLFAYSGGYVSSISRQKLLFANSPQLDEKSIAMYERKTEKLYRDISNKHRYAFQSAALYVVFNAGIKPFVKKKGVEYQGVRERWENIGIV